MALSTDRVAIVGGGFSGAMLAVRLADWGVASTVIDRTGDFGRGVAYSTPFDGHLLNVRSGRMSAVEGDPGHFVCWLEANRPEIADPDGFAPRRLYGDYVHERLTRAMEAYPDLIEPIVGEAAAIDAGGVRLADERFVEADVVVLATGNPAPRTAEGGSPRIIGDPWGPGALERIGTDDDILIVGTGLTMVDMVLALEGRGWRGKATALSRRGLVPRAHAAAPDTPSTPTPAMLNGALSNRIGAARIQARQDGWREMMEGLRPITADLWAGADLATRRRMVRHLRPWWDVHRHRLATRIGAEIDRLRDEGRLRVLTGRVRAIAADGEGVRLDYGRRREPGTLYAAWLIDCSGPGHAPDADPLTAPLIAAGRARLDPLRLGLDLDSAGRVLDRDGRPDPTLFVLGPPARAAFWETIAVPDIRKRIEDVATVLIA